MISIIVSLYRKHLKNLIEAANNYTEIDSL